VGRRRDQLSAPLPCPSSPRPLGRGLMRRRSRRNSLSEESAERQQAVRLYSPPCGPARAGPAAVRAREPWAGWIFFV